MLPNILRKTLLIRRSWGNANNYDLCINSASYGIDGTVDFILRMIGHDKDKKKSDFESFQGRIEVTHRMFDDKLKLKFGLFGKKNQMESTTSGGSFRDRIIKSSI